MFKPHADAALQAELTGDLTKAPTSERPPQALVGEAKNAKMQVGTTREVMKTATESQRSMSSYWLAPILQCRTTIVTTMASTTQLPSIDREATVQEEQTRVAAQHAILFITVSSIHYWQAFTLTV